MLNKIIKKVLIILSFMFSFISLFFFSFYSLHAENNNKQEFTKEQIIIIIMVVIITVAIPLLTKLISQKIYKEIFKYIKFKLEEENKEFVEIEEINKKTKIPKFVIKRVINVNSKVWNGTIGIYFNPVFKNEKLVVQKNTEEIIKEREKFLDIRKRIDSFVKVSYFKI